ncbi:MAG: hypothetical protein KF760_25145 [Candidatus Eremiobacteraeota bacterium]|nr:hypothetical protein [Candidatus Eremiobacteraeota bacterium]MCW5871029.1 hypothetical protein [Candidatus Eremiobacteraeota bacterium]
MQKMGLDNLFAGADLSGINQEADLCVSDVFHKANVEVNEDSWRRSDEFKADRPSCIGSRTTSRAPCSGPDASPTRRF